jgi:hypothetical protein
MATLRWFIVSLGLSPCLLAVAQAGVLAPTKASQVLTVNASGLTSCPSGGSSSLAFDQVVLGDLSSFPAFTIPPGQVFVVTGLEWRIIGAPAGSTTGATLRLDGNSTIGMVFFDTMNAGPDGGSGRAVAVPNVIVKPGITICLLIGGNGSAMSGLLHGFFARDK